MSDSTKKKMKRLCMKCKEKADRISRKIPWTQVLKKKKEEEV